MRSKADGSTRPARAAAGEAMAPVDLCDLDRWLRRDLAWPDGVELCAIHLHRLWAGRRGRIGFELALDLDAGGRRITRLLQGGIGRPPRLGTPGVNGMVTADPWLRNVGLVDDRRATWLCTPDLDRRLPALRKLLDKEQRNSLLAETAVAPLLRRDLAGTPVDAEIVAYRANKRCTLAVGRRDDPSGGVFVKVFRRPPTAERVNLLRNLADQLNALSGGGVRTPSTLECLTAHRLLITERIGGRPRPLGLTADDLAGAAQVAAMVHRTTTSGLPSHTPGDELQILHRWLRITKAGGGRVHDRLRAIVLELARRRKTVSMDGAATLHRDFYAAQVLRANDRLWLVDLDTLCIGHPEVDISTFIAHVLFESAVSGMSDGAAQRLAAGFLDAYRSSGGLVEPGRLQFYLPAALARLGAVHLFRRVPRGTIEHLWHDAERWLSASFSSGD